METWTILVASFILYRTTAAIKFTAVIKQYELTCGSAYTCSMDGNGSSKKNFYGGNFGHPYMCRTCFCDRLCLQRKDCCPNLVFSHQGLSCTDTAVLNPYNVDTHVLAVVECPANTTKWLVEKCSGNYTASDKMTQPLVSSKTKPVVYRNKFCADCNGENETQPWMLNVHCPGNTDLNHLNSFGAIIDKAESLSCSMIHKSPKAENFFRCTSAPRSRSGIKECNITGHWKTYDADIDWACRNGHLPYKHYANIFCYICNPGQSFRNRKSIIKSCNQTGHWSPYDANLQEACEAGPTQQGSYPFKNVYCNLCNRRGDDRDMFLDARVVISKDDVQTFYRKMDLSIHTTQEFEIAYFKDQDILKYISYVPVTGSASTNHSQREILSKIIPGMKVDVSKLLYMHFLHFGYQKYCTPNMSLTHPNDTAKQTASACKCDVSCVLTFDCCTDFALSSPLSFVKGLDNAVVSKCLHGTRYLYLREQCEEGNPNATFGHVPVQSLTTRVLYRNAYCFLCNEATILLTSLGTNEQLHMNFKSVKIKVDCNFLAKYEEYAYFNDYLRDIGNAQKNSVDVGKCYLSFESEHVGINRVTIDGTKISVCNISGSWDVYDPDVEWACNNYNPLITSHSDNNGYKNIFCKICNTNSRISPAVDYCNKSNLNEKEQLRKNCELYPRALSLSKYKNVFCRMCMDSYTNMKSYFPHITEYKIVKKCNDSIKTLQMSTMVKATYRKMFSFNAYTDNSVDKGQLNTRDQNHDCLDTEVYDSLKNICRPLHCIDGKYAAGTECRPFLPRTTSLGYTMAVRLEVTVFNERDMTFDVLIGYTKTAITDHIASRLFVTPATINFISMYLFTRQPCGATINSTGNTTLEILFHTSFFIFTLVDRVLTEERLINISSSIFNSSMGDSVFWFKTSYDLSAIQLPTLVHTDSIDNCFIVSYKNFVYDLSYYKLDYVSKLLTCQQVDIEKDQYELNQSNLQVTLLLSDAILNFGEYSKYPTSSNILICLRDFHLMMMGRLNSSISDTVDPMDAVLNVLQIISFICVCLSVIGLLLTFFTYCFFSSLRTLPGKNNMCLIVCLFFSQSLTLLGLGQDDDYVVCVVFGVLIHYFWLATFCSMNVCSFHMFRVFVVSLQVMRKNYAESVTCFRYICYCIGMPALIVASYISISVTLTKDRSIGYGADHTCFITSFVALIVTFVCPVLLISISNIIFFSVTAYKIRSVPRIKSNKGPRQEFSIYIKLFILTGISWVFQLIDSLVPVSIFSIFVGLVNSSQGIFIFFAYSVNKRVRSYYKDRISSSFSSYRSKSKESSTFEEQRV